MDAKEIGRFICSLRKDKGLTQSALAELLNISNRTVSKWETGEGLPDISLLPDLAKVLGVTTDEILEGKRRLLKNRQILRLRKSLIKIIS